MAKNTGHDDNRCMSDYDHEQTTTWSDDDLREALGRSPAEELTAQSHQLLGQVKELLRDVRSRIRDNTSSTATLSQDVRALAVLASEIRQLREHCKDQSEQAKSTPVKVIHAAMDAFERLAISYEQRPKATTAAVITFAGLAAYLMYEGSGVTRIIGTLAGLM